MNKSLHILITGGAGFIGTHLARQLVASGHKVTSWDIKTPTNPVAQVHYLQRDVRHFSDFQNEILAFDFVFHFAAIVSVPLCQKDPQGAYATNVEAAAKIAQHLAHHQRPLIFSSSSAVYGNLGSEHAHIAESLALPPPLSVYAVHKKSMEDVLRQLKTSQQAPFLSLRFFNVYGEGQERNSPYSGVMTIYAQAADEGAPLKVFGDGKTTRDFVHVTDVAKICSQLLELVREQGAQFPYNEINVGTGTTITINELAQMYAQRSQHRSQINYQPAREGDIPRSCADITRLKNLLGWSPQGLSVERLV